MTLRTCCSRMCWWKEDLSHHAKTESSKGLSNLLQRFLAKERKCSLSMLRRTFAFVRLWFQVCLFLQRRGVGTTA